MDATDINAKVILLCMQVPISFLSDYVNDQVLEYYKFKATCDASIFYTEKAANTAIHLLLPSYNEQVSMKKTLMKLVLTSCIHKNLYI